MKNFKKIISFTIAMVLCFSLSSGISLAAEETLLLYDDFTSIDGMAIIETHGDSKASSENGTFKVTINKANYDDGKVLAVCGDVNWLDYTLETKVKVDGNGPTDQFDIHFRYNHEGRSYMIGWMREKKSFFLLKDAPTWTGWAFDNLFFPEPAGFNPAIWNDIKVVVKGANIKLYVNESLVMDYTDQQNVCYWGKVGLGAETRANTEFNCWFDSIKVTGTVREVEQNPFTGFFTKADTLLKDSDFYSDNWNLGTGFSVKENQFGRYLSIDGTGNAELKNIDFDECCADMYLSLTSGELSAKTRMEAINIFYEVVMNPENGGSAKIIKNVNNSRQVLAETNDIYGKFGFDLTKQNWIRIRTLGENIGLFMGTEKTPVVVAKDIGSGIKKGKFVLCANNAKGSISDVYVYRANICVTVPAIQPVQPIEKLDMNHNDESDNVYATIYVSPNGNDSNNGIAKSSPFKTLKKALEYVKTINSQMTGNIVISVADGEYIQNETLKITPDMSGKNGYYVILKAEGKKADIISGAEVKNWEHVNGDIYRAKMSEGFVLEDFKEFYLNGFRKERARQWILNMSDFSFWDDPKTSYAPDGVYLSKSYLPKMETRTGMSLYFNKSFITYNHLIDEIIDDPEDETRYILKLRQPHLKDALRSQGVAIGSELYGFKIENAMELLDESGEWFFNKKDGYIYYYAEPGDDMSTAVGKVPGVERIVEVEGTVDNYVKNMKFEGLNFAYSGWKYVSEHGFQGRQVPLIKMVHEGGNWEELAAERLFNVLFADNLKFEDNTFQHTAGIGLFLENGVDQVSITGNIFNDIGYCGLEVGVNSYEFDYNGDRSPLLPYAQHWQPNDEDRACSQIFVANNIFNDCGAGYNEGVSIAVAYVNTMYILHNELLNSAQNATTVGWGFDVNGIASLQKVCLMYNKVVDWNICEDMHDIGCLYSVGAIMGYNVSENYLSGDTESGEKGVYLDNGSSYTFISENVTEDHYYEHSHIYCYGDHDSMIAQNYTLRENPSYDMGINNVVEAAITYDLNNPPSRVKQIMDNAGLESDYAYVAEKFENEIPDRKKLYPSYKLNAYKNGSSVAMRHDKKIEMSLLGNAVAEIKNGELYLPSFEAEQIALKKKGDYYGLSAVGNPKDESVAISFNSPRDVYENENVLIKAKQGEKVWNINGTDVKVEHAVYYKNGVLMLPMKQLYNALGIVDKHFIYDAKEDIMMVCDRLAQVEPDNERPFMTYLSEKFKK